MNSINQFNSVKVAKFFIDEKIRREREVKTASEKPKQQAYFKGVFGESKQIDHHDNDDDDMSGIIFDF